MQYGNSEGALAEGETDSSVIEENIKWLKDEESDINETIQNSNKE